MIKQLVLYSTSNCHLCETAEALLVYQNHKLTLKIIEIAEDEKLLEQYGTRIPVLKRLDTATELDWPFDATKINAFLSV